MKNLKKNLMRNLQIALLFGSLTFMSCSNNETDLNTNSIEKTSNTFARGSSEVGELSVGNKKYILNTDNSISRYIDDKHEYTISVVQNFNITNTKIENGYRFTNPFGEVITITFGRSVAEGKSEAQIEVFDSNGNEMHIDDIIIDDNLFENTTMGCPPCAAVVGAVIVEAISDILNPSDDFFTACRKSVQALAKACSQAGGKGSLHMESGWFGDTCQFTCR